MHLCSLVSYYPLDHISKCRVCYRGFKEPTGNRDDGDFVAAEDIYEIIHPATKFLYCCKSCMNRIQLPKTCPCGCGSLLTFAIGSEPVLIVDSENDNDENYELIQ